MKLEGILALTLLPSLQTGHFELLRRYLHFLHETTEHVVHQVLVLLVDLEDVWIVLVHLQVGIEDCIGSEG